MPILVFTILTPTLAFYCYALVQFWAEFRRRRHVETKVIVLRDSRLTGADYEPFPQTELEPQAANLAAIRQFALAAIPPRITAPPARTDVVTAFLKGRYDAFAAQTTPLAVKRAAKG